MIATIAIFAAGGLAVAFEVFDVVRFRRRCREARKRLAGPEGRKRVGL